MAEETLKIVINGEDKISNTLGGIKGKLSGLGDVAKNALGTALGLGLAALPGLAMNAMKGIGDMVEEAAGVEQVAATFDKLSASIGTTADVLMDDMREATRGMVNDADLMAASNKFMAMGLANSAEEAANLAEVATQLGLAMGEDATGSMENFALMMANQSIPRLDSFGISSGQVRTRIEELMEATKGLTREEAFNQAVMEQAAITMAKVGEQGDSTAATMAQIKANFENVKTTIVRAFIPVLDKLLKPLSEIAKKVGPKLTEWAQDLASWIGTRLQWVLENAAWAFEAIADVINHVTSSLESGGLLNALASLGDFPWEDVFPDWLADIIYDITGALDDLVGGVRFALDEGFDPLSAVITGIADVLMGLGFEGAAEGVMNFAVDVRDAIDKAKGWLIDFKENVLPDWKAKAVDAWDTAKAKVSEWWEGTAETRAKIGEWFRKFKDEIFPQWKEKAKEAFETAKEKVLEWWDDTADKRQAIVDWFIDFKENTLPEWETKFVAAWTTAKITVEEFADGFNQSVPAIKEQINEFIITILPELQRAWYATRDAIDALMQLLEPLLLLLWPVAYNMGLIGEKTSYTAEQLGVLAGVIIQWGLQQMLDKIKGTVEGWADAMEWLQDAIQWVTDKIEAFIIILGNLDSTGLPDWLTPGSPTPLEIGLRGIIDAMADLSKFGDLFGFGGGRPTLAPKWELMGAPTPIIGPGGTPGGALAAGMSGYGPVTINFGRESVRSDEDIENIARQIEEVLIRRGIREWYT